MVSAVDSGTYSQRPNGAREHHADATRSADPLAAVLDLGDRRNWVGLAFGLAGALFVHGAGAATSLQRLYDLEAFAGAVHDDIAAELRAVYDIEVEPPPPETEPPPPEEEVVEEAEPVEPTEPVNVEEPAPAEPGPPPDAAQVGRALTAEPEPEAPLDLTGEQWSMVTGPGTRYAGGTSQRGGKSSDAVRDRNAKAGGDRQARKARTRPPKKSRPAKDLSRPAMPASGGSWNSCGFPPEADMAQINYARVILVVTVGPDDKPQRVSVVGENPPGYGFGALARSCAHRKAWKAGRNRAGEPTTTTTPRINVTFER